MKPDEYLRLQERYRVSICWSVATNLWTALCWIEKKTKTGKKITMYRAEDKTPRRAMELLCEKAGISRKEK